MQPLTRDFQLLTDVLNDNASRFASWGQSIADIYNGVSISANQTLELLSKPLPTPDGKKDEVALFTRLQQVDRAASAAVTFGGSEIFRDVVGRTVGFFAAKGKAEREIQEKILQQKSFTDAGTGKGFNFEGVKYEFDQLTNTVRTTRIPSLAEQLKADEAEKEIRKLAETLNKFKISDVDNYLNFAKTKINASGDSDISKIQQKAEIEQLALKEKIRLQKQYFDLALDSDAAASPITLNLNVDDGIPAGIAEAD